MLDSAGIGHSLQCSFVTDGSGRVVCNPAVTPDQLSQTIEGFLAGSREAVITENGELVFDLSQSRYSISGEHHKCLLHVWSAERNVVRRVLDMEVKRDVLRFQVQRLGQTKPGKLEICRRRDARTPTAKRITRVAYRNKLERLLERRFPGFKVTDLVTTPDLERSFGPVYTRGLLQRGQTAFAVLGVNAEETAASVQAALTFGILWLDLCRQAHSGKLVVEGLKLIAPRGTSTILRERMGRLNHAAAKWQLYEFDEQEDTITELDVSDSGNVSTRLVHWTDPAVTYTRFASQIAEVRQLMPEAEAVALSPVEMVFRHRGLEFARGRLALRIDSFRASGEIVFGLPPAERVLDERNYPAFVQLVRSIGEARHAEGPKDNLLWRIHPERWLESLVLRDVSALDEQLDCAFNYSQVPAFSSSARAIMDVLAATRQGRLAVIELKADEDIHLPMQGLDYWSRVAWHHAREEFKNYGYFAGRELTNELPLLMLVAPALRIHPATDTLLRYLSPAIDWVFTGIGEQWREEIKVIFRKRSKKSSAKSETRGPETLEEFAKPA